jgi:putative glycosyltransferase (TIGR04372 family)
MDVKLKKIYGLLDKIDLKKKFKIISREPLLIIALPIGFIFLIIIGACRPFISIRIGFLRSDRLGHFAANTELYLCEKKAGKNGKNCVDIFYFPRKPCNKYLAYKWSELLNIWPWFFIRPLDLIIRSTVILNSFKVPEAIGGDRDIENLYEKFTPSIEFSDSELENGKLALKNLGLPENAKFVCLTVRDSSYLNYYYNLGECDDPLTFRDANIQNFILAAEALAERGYYVLRMGAKVKEPIQSNHPMVIDYATSPHRSEFMDIYLGAHCFFCISTGTGFDAIPYIFRRPMVYVNHVPILDFFTFRKNVIIITKHHYDLKSGKELTLSEILMSGVAYAVHNQDYYKNNVYLVENSPQEILDICLEQLNSLEGHIHYTREDQDNQRLFWNIYPTEASMEAYSKNLSMISLTMQDHLALRLHGEIRSRYGADFLRKNKEWLS